MKICRFIHDETVKFGILEAEEISVIETQNIFSSASNFSVSDKLLPADVKFLSPSRPSKIVCVGRNYSAHAAELGNDVPKEPLLFLKAPSSLITDGEAIIIPEQSSQVEHEGELAVVISRDCKNLSDNENPFEYVFGYACLNDVTARDLQKKDVQFTRAKSFDTFCPISSYIETELDVSDLTVVTKVNEIIKQEGRTSQMVFPVEFLIRYISKQMTLLSGDIIATGTPAGVSKLSAGDVCKVEIEGIGSLVNSVESSE